MSDEEYTKKLETLQQYIPFLDNMIQQLKDPTKKNREQQLAKMQSLHTMITDKKKKLKLETLVRCEDVISKLYEKVHNRPIGAAKRSNVNSPALTPASPSPPRETIASAPLTIPTERLEAERPKLKIDIYSSAAESLSRKPYNNPPVNARAPDMSKPPISLEDLKTLEEDVQDKINESSLKSASLSELNSLREKINEQIQMENEKVASPEKMERNINTTVRNNLSLTKKAIQPPEKPKVKEKVTDPAKISPGQKPKSTNLENDTDSKKDANSAAQSFTKQKSPKILKEPASIFGSILSNIDDQLLGGKKKKEEKKTTTPGKDERKLSEGGKEKPVKSFDKSSENKKEEKMSPLTGKPQNKSERKSEKSEKSSTDTNSSDEPKDKDKYFSITGKVSLEDKEKLLKEKLLKKLEERLKDDGTPREVPREEVKKDDAQKVSKDTTEEKVSTKEKVFSRISVKKDLELKPTKVDVPVEKKEDSPIKFPVFKRLADKYNPKPRKQATDADVAKEVADSIEEKMKTSPPKIPLINQMPEPVPPPASLVKCSQIEPVLPQPAPQLPAVLQNILNPSTTQLINTVVNHLRQTNAETEARKSPLVPTPPPLLGNPPTLLGNPISLLGNAPSLLVNTPTLVGNHAPVVAKSIPAVGNSPLLMGNPNIMSPPAMEDNFVSEYCRENVNTEDKNFRNQTNDLGNKWYTPPARPESRMRFETPLDQEMIGNQLGNHMGNQLGNQMSSQMGNQMGNQIIGQMGNQLGNQMVGQMGNQMINQLGAPQTPRYIAPGMGEIYNDAFMPNRQFNQGHPSMPDMFAQSFGFNQNQADMQSLDYYPPNAPAPSNQYNCGPPLLSPEVPHYHQEQKPGGFGMMNNDFFGHNEDVGHWRNLPGEGRFHWDRRDQDVRVNRDPRTYREYREMREARDPRVARDNREQRESSDTRDPRLNREPRDKDFRDARDRDYRDPRLNRDRDRQDKERSANRESRSQSRDYRPSRYDSKFDRMYSRTNRDRSRSRSRSRPRETFTSPLDSLYSGKEEHRTGKGYGVQHFRIPKIKKEDESKDKEEEIAKVSSTNEDIGESVEADTENKDAGESEAEEEHTTEQKEPITQENDSQKEVEEAKKAEPEPVRPETPTKIEVNESVKVQSQDEEPLKVTSSNTVEGDPKPADQTILAQFFANLLGSRNKRDKKTALYSLISTFSDSFSEKELSKITKIIKADDDEDESSEEEEEHKKVAQKEDEEKEQPKDETAADVGERSHNDEDKEEEVITPKPRPRRRIMRISSNSPSKEEKDEEVKPPDSQESETKEDEGVIVSVGERIKSRKRQSASPAKPKKKCKTELDLLHEDIQDMFIRDGVLTASGQRMCRILKGDPNVLSAVQEKTPTTTDPPKIRKKPGPKPKPKPPNAADVKVMKSVRVVISKIPEKNAQTEEPPKRNLRRSTRNVAYAESEEDNSTREEMPTVDEDSSLEDAATIESESEVESSDSEKEKTSQPTDNQKSRIVKRKRGKGWASGVLPSNKKKKKKQSSLDESEETPNKEADKSIDSLNDSDPERTYIEPDKNYYVDHSSKHRQKCKLCSYQGRFITTHYKLTHPLSEILTSRFSPSIAAEAIKDSEKNLAKYESILRLKGSTRIQFTCRFCCFNTHVVPTMFYDHITTHTGEYRHICPTCDFSSSSGKTLKVHLKNTHNNEDQRVPRKTYGQTIMFGYMCGECNYVQLNRKNVEEHINIFHLQKPAIYKINMSTLLDPEVEKAAQEKSEVESNESVQSALVENKKEKAKPKEEASIEKPVEEPKMLPPQRKKPGPKPGAKQRKKMEEKRALEDTESDSDSVTSKESVESKEGTSEKPAVAMRRVTRKESIEEECSPVRSRRAAKDKATEKLKTLMEATEGLSRRKSVSGDETKKHDEKRNDKPKPPEKVATPKQKDTDMQDGAEKLSALTVEEKKCEQIKASEEIKTPLKAVVKKEVEMNVFTCKTDILEENKKIEQERLQLMDELNKSVGSRTSLNFVDKLCNRLNQPDVVVKQEPHDNDSPYSRDTNNKSPMAMPVLQKEKVFTTPTTPTTPSTSAQMITPNKKPVLEPEVTQIAKSTFDVTHKNDKIITDMIQKLKGKLATAADDNIQSMSSPVIVDDNDYDSEGPPPLTHVNELVNIKPIDPSTKTLLIGGFVKVIKNSESLMFSCLVPPCVFSTEDKDAFQKHCREAHKQSRARRPTTLCELCGVEIVTTKDSTLLENLFKHIISDHADFIKNEAMVAAAPEQSETQGKIQEQETKPNRVLRIRRLSGDALSVQKNDWDELIPASLATTDDVEISAATADKEKEETTVRVAARDTTMTAETPPSEDQPATMVELNMSEDNPFPFKISGVMSLADSQPKLPPLAPIVTKPIQMTMPSQLIVKEARMTLAELVKPRKTAKAMAKFILSVSDLYKCPHYYCLFSTNFRDFLERHLKAHKVEQDIMIPCVYCDMKTPWEHVPMHIDIRHAHCRFACSYCLYRAVAKEYVFLHQDQVHPSNDYSVIALPQPKHSKKFAIAEVKVDPRTLCEPYTCLKQCNSQFLFENEFRRHLVDVHKSSFIPCGFQNCTNRVQSTKMISHWALTHGVCVYQCGMCKIGTNDLIKMYHHFAQCHPGSQPNILIRTITPLEGVTLGYTAEALKAMRKIITIPSNIIEQSKQEAVKQPEVTAKVALPTSAACSTAAPPAVQYVQATLKSPPTTKVQMVTPRQPKAQKSLLISNNTPAANRIAFVSTSATSAASNIILFSSADGGTSFGTLVMATSAPVVTAMAPSSNPTVQVVPSVEPIPSPSVPIEGVTVAPAPLEDVVAETSGTGVVQENQEAIEPLEHITLGDDEVPDIQTPTDDGDNGDIDPLSLDGELNDAAKATDADSSGDESDSSKVEKSKKQTKSGLLSYQLYRCAFCDISFSNSADFKKHATRSLTCRRSEDIGKKFVCVHCGRKARNPHVLVEHIQCHGVLRFSCSLCSNKYPTANQARNHLKTHHNINQTILIPANPNRTNAYTDEFVVRPKVALQPPTVSEAAPHEPSASSSSTENVYTPDQIDKIPIKYIFSSSMRCGVCTYNTKVRTNMVRHLQGHLQEKAVSESAPVNPVPCLEKNEKMFDKMVNLASSSHSTSRMGGAKTDGKEKEADNIPEFVQSHCRYVCPAQDCNYLCPEEANLRHHIIALHDGETSFTCVHCKANLSQLEADKVIKHFKLHGLQLYKCQYCSFVHHFKHKVEKHTADFHLDLPVKVIQVRSLEAEPADQEPSTSGMQNSYSAAPVKALKPWRCCMCKHKSSSLEGIQQHALEKHEIDSQFKCALCTYKNNDEDSFADHFKEAHDNQTVDIISAYRKWEDKEKENEAFDTTPLWQRDRPRVRHIRGILFDESSPVMPKTPKKTPRRASSPGPSGVRASTPSPAPGTSRSTNLDLSIESVAKGIAGILHDKPSASIAENFVELVNKYAKDTTDYVDAVEKEPVCDVIVIDDDDDKEPEMPLAKNKDNKHAPVAKNRPAKRKAPETPVDSKTPKLSDEVIDVESAGSDVDDQDEFSERNLRLQFAAFGKPLNRQLKCPVCNQFKSKRISDFIFHMFKEMKVYRFKCKICADESITFRYMYKHVQEHDSPDSCDDNIIFLTPNRKLEAWLQMVIREQSLIILQNFSPTPDDNIPSSKKLIACPHCEKKYQTEQERNEHSIVHWSLKPYGCKKCKFTAYNSKDVTKHLEMAHKVMLNIQQHVLSKAPTIARELKLSDNAHMKEVNSIHADSSSDESSAMDEEDPLSIPQSSSVLADPIPIPEPIEEDDELRDLVIVTKTDSNVPDENDIFCCEYCPFMTNSETHVLRHITSVHEHMHIKFKTLNKLKCEENVADYVGCMLCPETGSEIRIRQHHLDAHDGQTFTMYRYVCSLCNKKFFKTNGLKLHFTKLHTGLPLSYTGLTNVLVTKEASAKSTQKPSSHSKSSQSKSSSHSKSSQPKSSSQAKSVQMKTYTCTLCSYQRDFQSNSVNNVRMHIKQHFKAYKCGLCTMQFKSRWEAISHFGKDHHGVPEDIFLDVNVNTQCSETTKQILRDAKPVTHVMFPTLVKKNTARKSTSAPFQRVEEYSFYGTHPEPVDMSRITTGVEINGMTLTMSADRLSKIFDLNASVLVEDCNLPVNLTTLFDS